MPAGPNVKWEKSSEGLVEAFGALAPKDSRAEMKKMFGWPCCFVNDNLFADLYKQSIIFRKELAHWISRALEYASALPAKSKKAAKPATKGAAKSKA